jgi:hypothetical protein
MSASICFTLVTIRWWCPCLYSFLFCDQGQNCLPISFCHRPTRHQIPTALERNGSKPKKQRSSFLLMKETGMGCYTETKVQNYRMHEFYSVCHSAASSFVFRYIASWLLQNYSLPGMHPTIATLICQLQQGRTRINRYDFACKSGDCISSSASRDPNLSTNGRNIQDHMKLEHQRNRKSSSFSADMTF